MKQWRPMGILGRLLVAVVLTGLILWSSGPLAVGQALAGARPWPIVFALLLALVDRVLMAQRWLVLLRPFTQPGRPPFPTILRVFLLSTFVGTFLPASVGGDAVRVVALTKHGVRGSAVLASVLMDRLLGIVSLLIAAAAGFAVSRRFLAEPAVVVALVTACGASLGAVAVVFSTKLRAVVERLAAHVPAASARASLSRVLAALGTYVSRPGEVAQVLGTSVVVQSLRVLQGYCMGLALGAAAPIDAYFVIVPLTLLVMLLPVTIYGLGTSQAAFVWFFAHYGVPSATALAMSILFLALGIVGNLPGAFVYAREGFAAPARN